MLDYYAREQYNTVIDAKKYGASMVVTHEAKERPGWFDYVKQSLSAHYMRDCFPQMIGDGQYHVIKFDFYSLDRPDRGATEYRLVMVHSLANQRFVNVAIMPEISQLSYAGYKLACRWCGSEYHDAEYHPGTCVNCGGPK